MTIVVACVIIAIVAFLMIIVVCLVSGTCKRMYERYKSTNLTEPIVSHVDNI